MAEIFRPVYSVVDPATGKRNKRKSRTWWIRYYLPSGKRVKRKGYRDKKATEALAVELERKAAREAHGIFDPTDEHAKRPLVEHAEDFRRYLSAKANTPLYVQLMLFRLNAVLDGCRFVRVADLQASAVVEFLARLRQSANDKPGKSVKTANEYLAAAKGFTRWLWRDRRIVADPLACLSKLANGAADVRHACRDYSPDELRRLLETTRQSARPFRHLRGVDRFMIYLTAAATGFRTSELASMTPASFDLDGDTPTATVQAACTKNRREAVQPLPLDVATVLKDYLRDKPAGQHVWPGTWSNHASAKMIRRDLADARKAWLCEAQNDLQRAEWERSDFLARCDADGRYVDFHAIRHTFITMVGKTGVSAREHMDLARHSSYSMTARYSHSHFYDLVAAVQSLPIPTVGPDGGQAERAALFATGTDGSVICDENAPKNLGPNLGLRQDVLCDKLRLAETEGEISDEQKSPENHGFSRDSQGIFKKPQEWRRRESNPRPVALR